MLYKFFLGLINDLNFLNVFRYITFRIILASLTSMLLWFIFGPRFIALIKAFHVRQYIREEGPASHQKKAGTPTMGGLMVLGTAFVSCLLWADPFAKAVWLMWIVTLGYAAIGFQDDFLKIKRKHNAGLSGRQKLAAQTIIGLLAGLYLYLAPGFDPTLTFPGLKSLVIDLGPFYAAFAALVLVSTSSAVNLTDGLDGLAIGPLIMAAGTYMVFAYCAGNSVISNYLQISSVPWASEVAVVLASLIGASLGFLWFNTYPADIFLGDVGSLSLGAALGLAALIVKQELVLVLVGGLFVIEAMSVILQVTFFKTMGGRRLFRMSPLHHHFELKGWPEPKIIIRFWIIAIILGLAGLSTLKLR
ncbi:MAG: phospho-N-acetylmuramoyl-pentapeptide-transferase [Deltaproteobacteria bacterium]|jgi:phospho-N-acetylmuramoyl-pentapeptide-transferase|nr:phospho-N-acetylmuramoyl-pentapeptide-transferase [Deltaproteobacteria bacterium]